MTAKLAGDDTAEPQMTSLPGIDLVLNRPADWFVHSSDVVDLVLRRRVPERGMVPPTVAIRVIPQPGTSDLAMAASGLAESLMFSLNDLRVGEAAEADLAVGKALRFVATCQQGIFTLALDQVLVTCTEGALWLGLTCAVDDYDAASDEFDAMVLSLRAAEG